MGLEDHRNIIADLEQALSKIQVPVFPIKQPASTIHDPEINVYKEVNVFC